MIGMSRPIHGEKTRETLTQLYPEIVNHDIDVQGNGNSKRDGIKTADYIPNEAGANIDHAGNAEFRTLKADTIRLQDPITGKTNTVG